MRFNNQKSHKTLGSISGVFLACRAGVFLASERSDFLREMFGRHLGFLRQRKVGERNKFLPWGTPPPLTVNQTWRLSGRSRLCPNKTPALQATVFSSPVFGGGAWAHFPNSGWLSSLTQLLLTFHVSTCTSC